VEGENGGVENGARFKFEGGWAVIKKPVGGKLGGRGKSTQIRGKGEYYRLEISRGSEIGGKNWIIQWEKRKEKQGNVRGTLCHKGGNRVIGSARLNNRVPTNGKGWGGFHPMREIQGKRKAQ